MSFSTFKTTPTLLALSLATVISVSALAQQPATQVNPSPERLRAHITYLAGDKLEGRRTGTTGATAAANYIADEFARLGLKALPQSSDKPKNKFFQAFPYVAGVELGKWNELFFSTPDSNSAQVSANQAGLRVGEDWLPLGLSSNAKIENAQAVLVGYGLTVSELKHDNYAGANASGKIAIAFKGTPDGDNPHGQFARYDDVRWKAIAARNAGAQALLVIASENNFKDDRLAQLRYDNSGGDAGLPVVVVSRQAAAQLLGLDTSQLTEFEQGVRGKPSPASERASWSCCPRLARTLITLRTDLVKREVYAANIIGVLEGSDPTLKDETIVIGAHYDHLGYGGAGSLAPKEGEIHHGADDNASGTAGVIELARFLTSQKPRPRRSIVFAAFSGEEEGLLGSNYYVNHPLVSLANTIAMINMDMIGRMKNRSLTIGGMGTATEWAAIVDNANLLQGMSVTTTHGGGTTPGSGMPIVVAANGQPVVDSDPAKQFTLTLNADGYGPSDHSSFYAKQVPVLFFWTGTHEDYHKPSDTADKINYDDEARILGVVARIVQSIDSGEKRPTYTLAKTESTGRSTGFRVYLGTIPNYADSNEGLLLDGVREDSPAAKAGLKAGDRIVKLAGKDVRNVYDYTYALGEMKAGQEYDVEVMRGTERLKLKLTPAARR
jgi:hypothetical protein